MQQRLFQTLATCPAGPFVKSFQEIFLDYVPFEARAFHLAMEGNFGKLMRPNAEAVPGNMALLETMASKIVAMLISINELPTIRYAAGGGKLTARLANLVQEALDRYSARNPHFRPLPGGDLVIMDRGVDLCAPLLHEFSYQAMAQDLLDIKEGNRYEYKYASDQGDAGMRVVALDENDGLWVNLRHIHIVESSRLIIEQFNKFMNENKAAVKQTTKKTGDEENVASISELKETMNSLGEYQELKAQVLTKRRM